jgi:mannose-6-phosphate isomerase-like protein (cupin superfamily)
MGFEHCSEGTEEGRMNVFDRESAPRYKRSEGITSYLLASSRTCGAQHLTTTLVELEPAGQQRIHHHVPEQVYFVLEGSGEMSVGGEVRTVHSGDCIFIPSGHPHGLVNTGAGKLRYFSTAAPAFAVEEISASWPMPSERSERRTGS